MKRCLYLLLLVSQFSFSNTIYTYSNRSGTVLSNRVLETDKNGNKYTLEKKTVYEDSPDNANAYKNYNAPLTDKDEKILEKYLYDKKYSFVLLVLQWQSKGSVGLAPLMPIYTHKVVIFKPSVLVGIFSNTAFIDMKPMYFNEQYKEYNACMATQNDKVSYAKKNYKLPQSIEFPKNIKLSYKFLCSADYIYEQRPAFTNSELKDELKKLSNTIQTNPKLKGYFDIQ